MATIHWFPQLLFSFWQIDLPPLQEGCGNVVGGDSPFVVVFVKPVTFPLCFVDVSIDAPGLWFVDTKSSSSPFKWVGSTISSAPSSSPLAILAQQKVLVALLAARVFCCRQEIWDKCCKTTSNVVLPLLLLDQTVALNWIDHCHWCQNAIIVCFGAANNVTLQESNATQMVNTIFWSMICGNCSLFSAKTV